MKTQIGIIFALASLALIATTGYVSTQYNSFDDENLQFSVNDDTGIEYISTDKAPSAIGPYSQGTILTQQGLLYASGQIGLNPSTGELVSGGVKQQTIQTFKNIKNILEAGGSNLDNVFKTTVYLTDINDFDVMNKEYETFFSTNALPARSCIQISKLPREGALVEIEVIAIVP